MMNNYKYGRRSLAVIETLHPDLQKICHLAIKRSYSDISLHEGARLVSEQQEYFDNGKSKINPKDYPSIESLAEKAKHIVIPNHPDFDKSRALDFHVAEKYKGKSLAWNDTHLAYIAGVFISCAQELYEKGEITHILRWGGDWDSDGIIGLDHTLRDFPHLELIKPKN